MSTTITAPPAPPKNNNKYGTRDDDDDSYYNIPRYYDESNLITEVEKLYPLYSEDNFKKNKRDVIYKELAIAGLELEEIINQDQTNLKLEKLGVYLNKFNNSSVNKKLKDTYDEFKQKNAFEKS